MYCPLTGKPCNNPKNIHVTDVAAGQVSHLFICQECACELEQLTGGVAIEPPLPPPVVEPPPPQMMPLPLVVGVPFQQQPSPLALFMKLMKDLEDRHREQEVMQVPCPVCGQSLQDVVKTGRIGCPNCYSFFKYHLAPLMAKVQDGAMTHQGKHPKPKHDPMKMYQNSLEALQKKMDKAVKEERYEDAALIRDQIAIVKKKMEFESEAD